MGLRAWFTILELYNVTHRIRRVSAYSLVAPDKITIFDAPIAATNGLPEDIRQEVQDTVIHELGHHFGIDEARMSELEAERDRKRGSVQKT